MEEVELASSAAGCNCVLCVLTHPQVTVGENELHDNSGTIHVLITFMVNIVRRPSYLQIKFKKIYI